VFFQEEEIEEDPERLGLHVDDRLNVAEEDGRIQVNFFFFFSKSEILVIFMCFCCVF